MARFVEETETEIERATQYCDVRDLLASWHRLVSEGKVDLDRLMQGFSEAVHDRMMVLSLHDGELIYDSVGSMAKSLLGHDPLGKSLSQLDNSGVRLVRDKYARVMATGVPLFVVQHQTGLDAMGTNERLILRVRSGDLEQLAIYIRGRDEPNEILRSVFHASSDSISVLEAQRDARGEIVDFEIRAVNAESARRMHSQPDAVIGRMLTEVFPFVRKNGLLHGFARAIQDGKPTVIETRYPSFGQMVERQLRLFPHGNRLTITNVDLSPLLAASRAIEKQRNELLTTNTLLECQTIDLKASNQALEHTARELREEIARNRTLEAELVHLAHFDGLTGLPNRSFFEKRYAEVLDEARRTRRKVALCILDIDHFKDINDHFGHSAGDAVLREISTRLTGTLRRSDVIGRLGGDEFAVLLTEALDVDDARAAVHRMLGNLSAPFSVSHQDVPMGISVGVAIFPADGQSENDLMAAADLAVYRAKRTGRGRPIFFTPSLREEADRQNRMAKTLAGAIEAGQIVPYYQPLMDLRTGQLIGFEALARWQHPTQGVLGPPAFLDTIEEPALARALTSAMLDAVVADLRSWKGRNIPAHVSVNVTAFDLRQDGFAEELRVRLDAHGLSTRQLAIEVTETTVLSRDAERIAETLAEMRQLGFSISLDDFGTGYASLSHLLKLPVDSIKIDRSFITDVDRSPKTAAIVRSLVSLAGALGLEVVAEGIETRPQLDAIRSLGCHLVQGYLLSEPMPADGVPDFAASFAPKMSMPGRPIASVG